VQLDKIIVIVVSIKNQRTTIKCTKVNENVLVKESPQSQIVGNI
jgi:hypothetical protein